LGFPFQYIISLIVGFAFYFSYGRNLMLGLLGFLVSMLIAKQTDAYVNNHIIQDMYVKENKILFDMN
jgi:hypothetical protein